MPEVKVPELAESITEGTIARWLKQPGDLVNKGDYIVELETDKVNVEIISEFSGVIAEIRAQEGDTVNVGEVIAVVEEEGSAAIDNTSEVKPEKAEVIVKEEAISLDVDTIQENIAKKQRPIASPAARKLAREKGIDLTTVPTIDPLGRVRAQDIRTLDSEQPDKETKKHVLQPSISPVASDEGKEIERIRMSRRRQTIANRLLDVKQNTAMLTTFNEIDMTNVMELRKRRKEKFFKENDVKLGFMSFFTKAVVAALKKSPLLNAEIQGDEIIVKKFYDIGIAVSANEGLVVPVIRDADRKNFAEIEKEIMDLATKARSNKLSLRDLQGGTFTITNGGVFGSLLSTPILNGPQVGILGMHSIKLRPISIDTEKMENRPMMYIALSYDHRIVDGKEAVTFLAHVKDLIEDPESLLFEA